MPRTHAPSRHTSTIAEFNATSGTYAVSSDGQPAAWGGAPGRPARLTDDVFKAYNAQLGEPGLFEPCSIPGQPAPVLRPG